MNEKFICNMKECDLNDLRSDVKEIKNALLGDEFNKNGIIQRVEKVEAKQTIYDKYLAYATAFVVIFVFSSQLLASCS